MRRFALLLAALFTLTASPAAAQLSLPQLPGPALPAPGDVLGDVTRTAEGATDVRALRHVRELAVRDLLRRNRDTLEPDPNGQPIIRSQILAIAPNAAALERARAAGFEIVRTDSLDGIGDMITLRAPSRLSTRRALRQLREADPQGAYDFDHLHIGSGVAPAFGEDTLAPQQSGGGGSARIGLIDGGVGASMSGAVAAQRSFVGDTPVANTHATTVAALIRNAAPGARIFAADIHGGAPTGGASSAMARALSWLASENVGVINVSLVGPRNQVIQAVIARLVSRGFLIVAAVGNDGPAAAPLFPASYAGVVGVTGVDARERALVEAGRGPQVDFAAPGIVSAQVRGTSYAAPIVAGLLARGLSSPNPADANRALNQLRAGARDLGARGRDNVYGDGLVGADIRVAGAR